MVIIHISLLRNAKTRAEWLGKLFQCKGTRPQISVYVETDTMNTHSPESDCKHCQGFHRLYTKCP